MKTKIQDIFREIQPEGSFSIARRLIVEAGVLFGGKQVTCLTQEVELFDGSTFQMGKRKWEFDGSICSPESCGTWVRQPAIEKKRKDDGPIVGIEDNEGSLALGQVYLVFPKYPEDCSYVRIVKRHDLTEIAYWICDEWAEAPAEVMGAIIGAMCMGIRGTQR